MQLTEADIVASPAVQQASSAGFRQQSIDPASDIESQIYAAWHQYIVEVLGRSEQCARHAATRSISLAKGNGVVAECRRQGIDLNGLRAIDVGSGLGDVAIALAQAGAEVTAVEPCDAWRQIAERRSEQLGLNITHLSADAHDLPFEAASFDVLINLQVLEHVADPRQVVSELSRILKPGGYFSVSCENYLAFREQHYGVAWLPMMPKWLGGLYLRLRGRDPAFLHQHVTFTCWPSLARWFLSCGLHDESWVSDLDRLRHGPLIRRERYLTTCAGLLGIDAAPLLVISKNLNRLFRLGFRITGTK